MTYVVDTSAVLAALLNEPGGADVFELRYECELSVVNLAEIYTRLVEQGVSVSAAEQTLARFQFRIRDFSSEHALKVAELRPLTRHLGLSFGDRACLALGFSSGSPILTADKDWSRLDLDLDIRQIR